MGRVHESRSVQPQLGERWPRRRCFMAVESTVALAAFAGSTQLAAGLATPPDTDLPLNLTSWALPALWLFTSVAAPAAVAAWLAFRRSAWGPTAVIVASAALSIELAAQIPFLGLSALQLAFALIAGCMVLVALDARRRGWR